MYNTNTFTEGPCNPPSVLLNNSLFYQGNDSFLFTRLESSGDRLSIEPEDLIPLSADSLLGLGNVADLVVMGKFSMP